MAPAPASLPKQKAPVGDWIGGVLISLLLPIIGVIVGIVYIVKGDPKRDVGIVTLVLSLGMILAFVALSAAG